MIRAHLTHPSNCVNCALSSDRDHGIAKPSIPRPIQSGFSFAKSMISQAGRWSLHVLVGIRWSIASIGFMMRSVWAEELSTVGITRLLCPRYARKVTVMDSTRILFHLAPAHQQPFTKHNYFLHCCPFRPSLTGIAPLQSTTATHSTQHRHCRQHKRQDANLQALRSGARGVVNDRLCQAAFQLRPRRSQRVRRGP